MRFEINIEELASELLRMLVPYLDHASAVDRPALLSRSAAAEYLSVSVRTLDSFKLPRVVLADRCFLGVSSERVRQLSNAGALPALRLQPVGIRAYFRADVERLKAERKARLEGGKRS